MLKTIFQWFVYSSENADKLSRTIKGLSSFIPSVVLLFTVLHINVDGNTLLQLLDGIAIFVTALGTAVTAGYTVIAFLIKIWTTINGSNEVILGHRTK